MTNRELEIFVSAGIKDGEAFKKEVEAVYYDVFNMASPCAGCMDKHLKMFKSIEREVTKRKKIKAMGKSNQKYSFNPEFKGVSTFVKIGANVATVTSYEKDQEILKALHAKKPHLVIVDGEAEETTAGILKKAKDLKIVAFTKKDGYSYNGVNFGKDEAEAVAFLEEPENEDSFSVIKEEIASAEKK